MALKELSVPASFDSIQIPSGTVPIPPEHHTVTCLGMQPAWEDEAGSHAGSFLFFSYPNDRPLAAGEAFVALEGSTYSPGTEGGILTGRDVYTTHEKDEHGNFWPKDAVGLKPMPRLTTGYAEVGTVIASNNRPGVQEGQRVALTCGHKTGHRLEGDQQVTVLPDDMDPRIGSLVRQFAVIWDMPTVVAADRIYGQELETMKGALKDASGEEKLHVLVCGAGPIGLGAAEVARWAGAKSVVVLDNNATRLEKARDLGFETVNNSGLSSGNAVELERFISRLRKQAPTEDIDILLPKGKHLRTTTGEGFPLVYNTVPNDQLLADVAFKAAGFQGIIADMAYNTKGMPHVVTGLEPHHKGLQHLIAQVNEENRPYRQRHLTQDYLAQNAIPFLQKRAEDLLKLFTEAEYPDAQEVIPNLPNHPEIVFLYMKPGDLSQVDAKPW